MSDVISEVVFRSFWFMFDRLSSVSGSKVMI